MVTGGDQEISYHSKTLSLHDMTIQTLFTWYTHSLSFYICYHHSLCSSTHSSQPKHYRLIIPEWNPLTGLVTFQKIRCQSVEYISFITADTQLQYNILIKTKYSNTKYIRHFLRPLMCVLYRKESSFKKIVHFKRVCGLTLHFTTGYIFIKQCQTS